jgi:hypothetical protein
VWSDAADGWREMPATVWADALVRYRAMPVPERAAEVLARVAPALAESFDNATWDADSSGGSVTKYAVSPDGLGALERGDVAEIVARRLPE